MMSLPLPAPFEVSEENRASINLYNSIRGIFEAQWGDSEESMSAVPIDVTSTLEAIRASIPAEIPGFRKWNMEDAHEAFRLVLTELSAALTNLFGIHAIDELFTTSPKRHLKCVSCGQNRESADRSGILDWLLPMDPRSPSVTLAKGLEKFFASERLGDVECPACKARGDHDSEHRVTALSQLLLIAWRRTTAASSRIMSYVFSPPVLEFEKLAVPGATAEDKYRLTAIVHHHGNRAKEGHYTVEFLHPDDGTWYKGNDEIVAPLNRPPQPLGSSQTIYLYQRII
jgi:uncharacterized UBP type Zn finger protein